MADRCLAYALEVVEASDTPYRSGIFGGLTPKERTALVRGRAA